MANSKNPQNLEELTLYKQTVLVQIDSTFPPFFIPKPQEVQKVKNLLNGENSPAQFGIDAGKIQSILNQERIIEPYSEHEDYLEKDDFGKILSAIGSYAGKTGNKLLNFGENILNQYVFRKQESSASARDEEE